MYVCPSPLHCGLVYDKFNEGICVAPQNCNFKGPGAFTGEMCADQRPVQEQVVQVQVLQV